MPRPFAVIGLTFFAVAALLYNASGTVVVVSLLFFAVCFALSLCVKPMREGKVFPLALACAATVCLVLTVHNEFFYYPQLKLAGDTHEVSVRITSDVRLEYGNCYYDGRLTECDGQKAYAKVRLVLPADCEVQPYDEVKGSFTFYSLGSSGAAAQDRYKTENRFLGAYPSDSCTVSPYGGKIKPPGYYVVAFRSSVANTVMSILPNDYGALCLALLLGERSELSRGVYADMTGSGITHIICVSGLHLTIWTGVVLFILRRLRIREKTAAALTLPVVILLMLAAGLTYSVIRAGIMIGIYLLSIILSRRRDPLNSLGIAITAIGVFNPFAMGAVSLKLSVLATLGIIVYSEYCAPGVKEFFTSHKKAAFLKKPAEMLLVTGAAMLFCMPVTVEVYGTVNFAVFPSNLLVIWAGEACMILSALAVLVASISTGIFNLPGLIAGALAKYIIKVISVLSGFGLFRIKMPAQSGRMLLVCIFAFCALLALMKYSGKKLLPAAPAVLAGLIITCAAVTAVCRAGETRIRIFDTGNGSAVLVSEKGENVLFGCGGDSFSGANDIINSVTDEGGALDAVVIPSSDKAFASYFYTVCREKPSLRYYLGETVDTTGLNIPSGSIMPLTDTPQDGRIKFTPLGGESVSGYYVTTGDISFAVLFYPGDSGTDLKLYEKDAQVLITRMDYPQNVRFENLVYTVIQADNSRGCYLQDELSGKGVTAVATAENGDIVINAYNGKINLEREE